RSRAGRATRPRQHLLIEPPIVSQAGAGRAAREDLPDAARRPGPRARYPAPVARRRSWIGALAGIAAGLGGAGGAGAQAGDPFAVQTLASDGRIVTAEIADVDGDGRGDLVTIATRGVP